MSGAAVVVDSPPVPKMQPTAALVELSDTPAAALARHGSASVDVSPAAPTRRRGLGSRRSSSRSPPPADGGDGDGVADAPTVKLARVAVKLDTDASPTAARVAVETDAEVSTSSTPTAARVAVKDASPPPPPAPPPTPAQVAVKPDASAPLPPPAQAVESDADALDAPYDPSTTDVPPFDVRAYETAKSLAGGAVRRQPRDDTPRDMQLSLSTPFLLNCELLPSSFVEALAIFPRGVAIADGIVANSAPIVLHNDVLCVQVDGGFHRITSTSATVLEKLLRKRVISSCIAVNPRPLKDVLAAIESDLPGAAVARGGDASDAPAPPPGPPGPPPVPRSSFGFIVFGHPTRRLDVSEALAVSLDVSSDTMTAQSNRLGLLRHASVIDASLDQTRLFRLARGLQPTGVITPLREFQRVGVLWMLAHERGRLSELPECELSLKTTRSGAAEAAPAASTVVAALSRFGSVDLVPMPMPTRRAIDSVLLPDEVFWRRVDSRTGTEPPAYLHSLSRVAQRRPPRLARGALLADDMGLGKSLQTISLIQADLDAARKWAAGPKVPDSHPRTHATLVVCPVAVLSHWKLQCEMHTGALPLNDLQRRARLPARPLRVLVYHGPDRFTSRTKFLAERYDVVLTTFTVVLSEARQAHNDLAGDLPSDQESDEDGRMEPGTFADADLLTQRNRLLNKADLLFSVRWRRVVLDEAHTIRNQRTRAFYAARRLHASRRWCLTGTPIMNKLEDVFSLVRFLRIRPFSRKDGFDLLREPLEIHLTDPTISSRMSAFMRTLALRRTKTMRVNDVPLVDLPSKRFTILEVNLRPLERIRYDALRANAVELLRRAKLAGEVTKEFMNILERILRMRQACDHLQLVAAVDQNTIIESVDTRRAAHRLRTALADSVADEIVCMMCDELALDAVVSDPCCHMFCRTCIETHILEVQPSCPACNGPLTVEKLFSISTRDPTTDDAVLDLRPLTPDDVSSKLETLVEFLRDSLCDTGFSFLQQKIVVFSQFKRMLHLVARCVTGIPLKFAAILGDMSPQERDVQIERFRTDKTVNLMLVSLRAGGVGLDLSCANTVIMIDPWWAPAVEEQAVDRVHRLGQTQPVSVVRLIARDTVEERVLELQEAKRTLAQQALGDEVDQRRSQRLTVDDLETLLN